MLGAVLLALGLAGGGFAQEILSLLQAEFSPPRVQLGVGETVQVSLLISIAPGWHINSVQPDVPFLIPTELQLDAPPGVKVEVAWPAPERVSLPLSQEPLELYQGDLEVSLTLFGEEGLAAGTLSAVLRYQACNDEVCVPPVELQLSLPVEATGPVGEIPVTGVTPSGQLGRGLLWGIVFAFLLGLGLNLTPCVYPMVPVTVAYFAGGVGRRLLPTLGLAVIYLLGIALTYSVLGVTASLGGGMLGEALRHPGVPIALAALMVLLSLSFFGVYTLRAPAGLLRRLPRGKGGPVGAFLMGAVVGLVAAPCVGPATVALLSYVASLADPLQGFLLFFSLAMGLGLPYVGLALASGKLARLPRSGPWTTWVERLLGLLLLGMALYLVAPLLPEPGLKIGIAVLALGGGAYLFWAGKGVRGRTFQLARVAVLLVGIAMTAISLAPRPGGGLAWVPYRPALLAQAEAENEPVLLYFSADWCIPCRKLAATTFRDREVLAQLDTLGVRPIKADLTWRGGEAEELRRRFSVSGVPTLVFLRGSRELGRLVGYVSPQEFLETLTELFPAPGGLSP